MMHVFGIFIVTRPKHVAGDLMPFRILYIAIYRYDVSEHSDVSEQMGVLSSIQL